MGFSHLFIYIYTIYSDTVTISPVSLFCFIFVGTEQNLMENGKVGQNLTIVDNG